MVNKRRCDGWNVFRFFFFATPKLSCFSLNWIFTWQRRMRSKSRMSLIAHYSAQLSEFRHWKTSQWIASKIRTQGFMIDYILVRMCNRGVWPNDSSNMFDIANCLSHTFFSLHLLLLVREVNHSYSHSIINCVVKAHIQTLQMWLEKFHFNSKCYVGLVMLNQKHCMLNVVKSCHRTIFPILEPLPSHGRGVWVS